MDRSGRGVGQVGAASEYSVFRLSPDGQSVAVSIPDVRTGSSDIWIHDLARDTRTHSPLVQRMMPGRYGLPKVAA
ncbi:MAG: hypothetical protein ND866_13040 [Pyrinomonadaceae bacterium]|nr:hypothetical protein [Pyrinomonadaceae bacterium]